MVTQEGDRHTLSRTLYKAYMTTAERLSLVDCTCRSRNNNRRGWPHPTWMVTVVVQRERP